MEKILYLYKDKIFQYDGKNIENASVKESKKYFVGANIPIKYIDNLTFKMNKNLSEDELALQVELKMYEEGGLKAEEDYIIDFLKFEIEDEYIIEAFALNKNSFDEVFKDIKVEAIDLLFPKFFIYQIAYKKDFDETKNDIFLHLSEDESFVAIYKKGKYIGHRAIDSLNSMAKKLGVDYSYLKEILINKGFIKDNYSLDEMHIYENLYNIFFKNIEKVIYSINYKRSIFALDNIDNVFLDFEGEFIEGLKEFFDFYAYEVNIEKFKCCDKANKELDIYLNCEYIYNIAKGEELQKINLSFLERKKPIYKYESFYFASFVLLFLLLIAGVYLYLDYEYKSLTNEENEKIKRYELLKKASGKLAKKIKDLNKKIDNTKKSIEDFNQKYYEYETTIKMLPFIEEQKIVREKIINDIVEVLAKNRLKAKFIKQKSSKEVEIFLISSYHKRDKIAKFINDMIDKGYSKVFTKKIIYDNRYYTSVVKVFK